MSRQEDGGGLPTQDYEGIGEVFEVKVDGRGVWCAWIPAFYFPIEPTNREVIREIKRRNFHLPTREIAQATFDLKQEEMDRNPSVAIESKGQIDGNGVQVFRCICEYRNGRHYNLYGPNAKWRRNYRFLVVVSQ